MRLSILVLLAGSASRQDRLRSALVVGAAAVSGSLLIAAASVARLQGELDGSTLVDDAYGGSVIDLDTGRALAPYVAQSGLRPGVVLGILLLTVPVVAFSLQVLRLGGASRNRRSAALRLAGATPSEVRRIAVVDTARAAIVGALLSGPCYLLLSLLLGRVLPRGSRLLPDPTAEWPLWWAAVVVLLGLGGVCAGIAMSRRVVVDPLGERRRVARTPRRALRVATLSVAALVVIVAFRAGGDIGHGIAFFVTFAVVLVAIVVAAFAAGPLLVRFSAGRLARRRGAVALLASSRTIADPYSLGRVAGVLALCGIAFGVELEQAIALFFEDEVSDRGFYLTGFALAGAGTAFALLTGAFTMVVGAIEQLVDAPRPSAALAALGVETQTLQQVLRRQLTNAALPAVGGGVVLGALLGLPVTRGSAPTMLLIVVLAVLATPVVCGVVAAMSALVTQLLAGSVRAAADPENLRTA